MTCATTDTNRIHDPIRRTSMAFRREGTNLWVETWFEDGAHLPEHFHPTLEEHWEILQGTVQLKLDGRWRELTVADGAVAVARHIPHELRNTSGAEAHARTKVTPAGHLQEFLTEAAVASRDGLITRRNLPTSLRAGLWLAAFAQRFQHETVITSPPPALQRLIVPVVARFAPHAFEKRQQHELDHR